MNRIDPKLVSLFVSFLLGLLVAIISGLGPSKARTLMPDEVPVVFWSWRSQTPTSDEVKRVSSATGANALYLRAGQLDLVKGEIVLIRRYSGDIPAGIDVHLVYNATRDLLKGFESVNRSMTADFIRERFLQELSNSHTKDVRIAGLQLDLDIPTRLLPEYAELLKLLRSSLPSHTRLSITGLPTWVGSPSLPEVLDPLDHWVPQCYGLEVPTNIDDRIPTSSIREIRSILQKIRKLDRPFYVGLSAYGVAFHYSAKGDLLEMRGDLDPLMLVKMRELELVSTESFESGRDASEVRYEYVAKADTYLDGLSILRGEALVLNVPTSNSLRMAARVSREDAGDSFLGLAIFRLPTAGDETSMTLEEISAALHDRQTVPNLNISAAVSSNKRLEIKIENTGNARALLREDALHVEMDVPPGSIEGVTRSSGFSGYATLCRSLERSSYPCSRRRANVLRVTAGTWKPGSEASIELIINGDLPDTFETRITTSIDDGRVDRQTLYLQPVNNGDGDEKQIF